MGSTSAPRSSTTSRPRPPWTVERLVGVVTDRYGLVLILLLATYVLASALPLHDWVAATLVGLQGVTVTLTLAASGASQAHRRASAAAALAALAVSIGAAIIGGRAGGVPALICAILLSASLLAIVRRLLVHERVTSQTLLGAMCCYVLFGLIYTFVYAGVSRLDTRPFLTPATSHSLSDFLFFSFTTLTTTGYGNLVPANGLGRALAMLEALTGQLFLVTVVARLVAMWMPRLRRPSSPRAGDDESPRDG